MNKPRFARNCLLTYLLWGLDPVAHFDRQRIEVDHELVAHIEHCVPDDVVPDAEGLAALDAIKLVAERANDMEPALGTERLHVALPEEVMQVRNGNWRDGRGRGCVRGHGGSYGIVTTLRARPDIARRTNTTSNTT
jgi:hypothetical protein